jgi:hypothetical protein
MVWIGYAEKIEKTFFFHLIFTFVPINFLDNWHGEVHKQYVSQYLNLNSWSFKELTMKKGILLAVVVLLSVAGLLQAQDKLGVTLDTTYASKYIWRGFDLFDDKSAFQPSIDVDLFGSGFSFNLWSAQPTTGGNVNGEEWDYTMTYANSFFDGERYKTDYSVSYVYYNFPDNPQNVGDAQEVNAVFSWPDLCPMGVVPHYALIRMWPSKGGGPAADLGGFIHVFGFGYDFDVPGLPDQSMTFTWDMTYNDGTGLGDGSVDHDWSHMVWGLSTAVDFGPGKFTPALYWQKSMDSSVNTEDEFWTTLSYSISF